MTLELLQELVPIIEDLLNIDADFLNPEETIKKILEDESKKEQIENLKNLLIKINDTEEGKKISYIMRSVYNATKIIV